MVIKAKIVRGEHGDEGSFGMMLLDGKVFCVTLEPPDRGNAPNVSSIPLGAYECEIVPSPLIEKITKGVWKVGWRIKKVPGRSAVMIHPGNFDEDTHGCVLVGQGFDKLRGERAINNSGATFNTFMTITRNSGLSLQIVEAP